MFEFKTATGNAYAWDDKIGLFVPFSSTMAAIINEINTLESVPKEIVVQRLKSSYDEEDIALCYDWIVKWRKIKPRDSPPLQSLKVKDVKRYVLKHCLDQLILNVTESCNFRCKYCAFSGLYKYARIHSNRHMDFITAKKAIDRYLDLSKQGQRYNPLKKPSIGFYGGEPLLNYDLIRKCVEYIEDQYKNLRVKYNMTTNGSLLDEDKADWLMQHDFSIGVSIDGPEEVHNRNRVYINGQGTFRDVMKNIGTMMDAGYEKLKSLAVFDLESDLFKCENFFNQEHVPILALVNPVSESKGSLYYNRFSDEQRLAFLEQLDRARKYYIESLTDRRPMARFSFFDAIFGDGAQRLLNRPFTILAPHQIMPFTSACVLGKKIFVDVDGNFHACEKVAGSFPFGDVEVGLDFEKISQILNNYYRLMDKCPDCQVKRTCNKCYVTFATDKGLSCLSSEICQGIEPAMSDSFSLALSIAEVNPRYVDQSDPHISDIKKYYGE